MASSRLTRRACMAAAWAVLLLAGPARAQATIDGTLLGQDPIALQDRFADLQKLPRPVVGPHGLRGTLQLQGTPLAGLPFDTTFFMRGQQLQRIEQRWQAPGTACDKPFLTLASTLDARYGSTPNADSGAGPASAPFKADLREQRAIAWDAPGYSVTAFRTELAGRCTLLVVFEPRQEKDASEL